MILFDVVRALFDRFSRAGATQHFLIWEMTVTVDDEWMSAARRYDSRASKYRNYLIGGKVGKPSSYDIEMTQGEMLEKIQEFADLRSLQ